MSYLLAGKEKTSSLRLLTSNTEEQEIIAQLGQTWDLLTDLIDMLEAFTCLLHSPKLSFSRVNRLWYDLFCAKKRELESYLLPPCKYCFVEHVQRTNYQVAVCRKFLHQDPEIPSPFSRGWKETEDGTVTSDPLGWMASQHLGPS